MAYTLANLGMDDNTICAALLHDVLEDTDTTYEDIEKCIKDSDFIIETIVEDYETKKEIHEKINKYMKDTSISSSITSGISINKLAESYDDNNRKKFFKKNKKQKK